MAEASYFSQTNVCAGARVFTAEDVGKILDVFQAHGHYEVRHNSGLLSPPLRLGCQLDTARTYAAGTSEEILGEVGWQKRGLMMDTKLYPNTVRMSDALSLCIESPSYC